MIRSRIAPTPSGFLHKGNAFSFLWTWLLVRSKGGILFLRIDDLDFKRKRAEYVEDIFHSLEWLGIDWDEGPEGPTDFEKKWSQLKRLDIYEPKLDELNNQQLLFECKCSRKEIMERASGKDYDGFCLRHFNPKKELPSALRFDSADLEMESLTYLDTYSSEKTFSSEVHYPILKKKNGFVAYHLASVADDCHFRINTIVRGADLIASSHIQMNIARFLPSCSSYSHIQHYHHALIADEKGEKLSKSAGASSLKSLREASSPIQDLYTEFVSWMGMSGKPQSLDELLVLFKERG